MQIKCGLHAVKQGRGEFQLRIASLISRVRKRQTYKWFASRGMGVPEIKTIAGFPLVSVLPSSKRTASDDLHPQPIRLSAKES